MTSPRSAPSLIELFPIFRACPHGPNPAFGFRPRWLTRSGVPHTVPAEAWITAETSLSILPRGIRDSLDLEFYPHLNWGSYIPPWHGLTFGEIGRVIMSVSSMDGMAHLVHVLVVVPDRDPDWLPPAVLLGTQFLVERGGFLNLDCHQPLCFFPPFTHRCGLLALA